MTMKFAAVTTRGKTSTHMLCVTNIPAKTTSVSFSRTFPVPQTKRIRQTSKRREYRVTQEIMWLIANSSEKDEVLVGIPARGNSCLHGDDADLPDDVPLQPPGCMPLHNVMLPGGALSFGTVPSWRVLDTVRGCSSDTFECIIHRAIAPAATDYQGPCLTFPDLFSVREQHIEFCWSDSRYDIFVFKHLTCLTLIICASEDKN